MEVSKCTACGAIDSIHHTTDVGYCQECYAVENYEYITEEDDNE